MLLCCSSRVFLLQERGKQGTPRKRHARQVELWGTGDGEMGGWRLPEDKRAVQAPGIEIILCLTGLSRSDSEDFQPDFSAQLSHRLWRRQDAVFLTPERSQLLVSRRCARAL